MNMNEPRSVLLVLALATAASPLLARSVDLSKLPPPAKQEGVTYAKDIRPIFEASCIRCHGPEKPKAGLRLDSLEAVLKGSKEGKVIQPGQSTKSHLVIAVARLDEESAMPPKPKPGRGRGGQKGPPGSAPTAAGTNQPVGKAPMGPPPKPLTPEQVGLVRAWVDQGAK
jgi:mono/diheme cytochrome c family protein